MKSEDKMYMAFFESKAKKLYYSQLKDLTKLSHSSLQNTLKRFVTQNILLEDKQKAHVFYEIKQTRLFALKYSEIALRKFANLNRRVRIPLENFLQEIPQNIYSIVLFGSASRGEEQNESDIDILVVSDTKLDLETAKKHANSISHYPLSVFECTMKEFLEAKDPVILQSRKTGFPLKGEQYFYEAMLNEY